MKEIRCSELNNISKIHMIGVGGISMSGIAIMLKKSGFDVTGSDSAYGDMIDILKNEGIQIVIGSSKEMVESADIVVYTAAISKATDIEYLEAKRLNKPTFERAVFLGKLLRTYAKPISIAGMHGKTTTTSMVASALQTAGVDPTVLVGSKLKELGNLNYLIGSNEYFVLESCEYVDSFLNFAGDCEIILNIEEDHLDYFKDLDDIKKSFKNFMLLTHDFGNLVINKDNSNAMSVLEDAKEELKDKNIKVYTYSIIDENADIFASNIKLRDNGCYEFDLYIKGKYIFNVELNAPGRHNVSNALATFAVVNAYGLDFELAKKGLEEFVGAGRRFEYKKTIGDNIAIYDDYAHHPTEIKATIQTAKEKNPGRIISVFQPHTYSRTKTLFNEFANAFYGCDIVIITEIYAAREIDDGSISSQMLVDELKKNNVNAIYIDSFENVAKYLEKELIPNDIVLTIGAGTITKLSDYLK